MRTFEQIREFGGTAWWPLDDGCDDHRFVWPVVVRHHGGPDWSVIEVKARDRSARSGNILDIEMSAPHAMLARMTRVRIGESWVVTVLPSGVEVHAHPRSDQAETAASLGYGDDVAALTRDHDPIHTLLAEWLGAPASYALRVAAGELTSDEDRQLADLEEAAVIAVQRFAKRAGLMSALHAMLVPMDDPENHARLSGLLAILALPLLRGDDGHLRRVHVEILVRDSGLSGIAARWVTVEGADVEAGKLTIWAGTNGKRMHWEFEAAKCPEWRTIKPAPKFLIDDEDPSPRLHT